MEEFYMLVNARYSNLQYGFLSRWYYLLLGKIVNRWVNLSVGIVFDRRAG